MRWRFVAFACVLSTAGACGGGSGGSIPATIPPPGTCPPIGFKACPNDLPASQSDVDACELPKDDAICGAAFLTYLDCFYQNARCTSSGHFDGAKATASCASQKSAWQTCQAGGGPPGCGMIGAPATAACESCLDTNCCAAKTACAANFNCVGLIQCVSTCSGATCQDCLTLFADGAAAAAALCVGTGQPCETTCAF